MSRSCARPTCSIAAAATMSYDYDAQIVWIESLHIEGHPMTHDLCVTHADRSKPPQVGYFATSDHRGASTPYMQRAKGKVGSG